MWEKSVSAFELNSRLAADSDLVMKLELSQLRVQNDRRWPWLVLVPERADMSEIFELSPEDQALLQAETSRVGAVLKELTGATKINIAAIGNKVRQLHVHVIARFEGDANWPGPIWGFGEAEPYTEEQKATLFNQLCKALS